MLSVNLSFFVPFKNYTALRAGMVAYTFNSSTQEAEVGGSAS